jgi:hypothetical protein
MPEDFYRWVELTTMTSLIWLSIWEYAKGVMHETTTNEIDEKKKAGNKVINFTAYKAKAKRLSKA